MPAHRVPFHHEPASAIYFYLGLFICTDLAGAVPFVVDQLPTLKPFASIAELDSSRCVFQTRQRHDLLRPVTTFL
jgi:hypothetical protein